MRSVLENSRFLVVVASLTSLALAAVTFAWGVAKSWSFASGLVDDSGWKRDTSLVALLEAVDTLLLGTVLLIFAVGLWELFVTPLTTPDWLQITDLDDLKGKLGSTLVLVLVIQFLQQLVQTNEALDLLYLAGAVTLVGGLLIAYTSVGKGH